MIETVAFGLVLRLHPTVDGGRIGPIVASRSTPFTYRPNWGLPSMEPPSQTGAPVFGFSMASVDPGGQPVRAVIVVPYPQTVAQWESEVFHGVGTVIWRRAAHYPSSPIEASEFSSWLDENEG